MAAATPTTSPCDARDRARTALAALRAALRSSRHGDAVVNEYSSAAALASACRDRTLLPEPSDEATNARLMRYYGRLTTKVEEATRAVGSDEIGNTLDAHDLRQMRTVAFTLGIDAGALRASVRALVDTILKAINKRPPGGDSGMDHSVKTLGVICCNKTLIPPRVVASTLHAVREERMGVLADLVLALEDALEALHASHAGDLGRCTERLHVLHAAALASAVSTRGL